MGSNLQLNSQIENYINNYSIDLHPVQKEIIKYNEKLGEIKKMQISVSQCHFLHFIIKITNPKNILEIGTFTGLSTLTMALASNDDTSITALDKNKETSKTARSFFDKANLSKKINLLVNNAKKSLEDLVNSNKYFDMVFIDADKENYIYYFEKSCETYITALQTRQPLNVVSDAVAEKTALDWENYPTDSDQLHLNAIRSILDMEDETYKS